MPPGARNPPYYSRVYTGFSGFNWNTLEIHTFLPHLKASPATAIAAPHHPSDRLSPNAVDQGLGRVVWSIPFPTSEIHPGYG
ncbi:hypothetical protein PCANC_00254 [Puccinia coronata f. sp. avenae]|uniref:Uncharacterized protein n=1 Tax=Puccinia coronata f. sp. avenae TaxID=200324 RepID=A0A2N5W9C7_9BASI|nr:hypothetical protein PCANC_00254 [Puccinia coronata f. sp. avenae]